jgi:hypothetical protein
MSHTRTRTPYLRLARPSPGKFLNWDGKAPLPFRDSRVSPDGGRSRHSVSYETVNRYEMLT